MITFYTTVSFGRLYSKMTDIPYLLPASSWSRGGLPKPKLPPQVKQTAADSGGFVATFKWGDYRYTPQEYVNWLLTFKPEWAATMDYCCELPITGGKENIVQERQQRTTDMAWLFWKQYRETSWVWVPTIQGWYVEDYIRHAREMRPLILEMQKHADSRFRVGIGTLCARASSSMVQSVVRAVAAELPGIPLHLWGVKLGVLKSPQSLTQVVSVDSAAWNGMFGKGRSAWKQSQARGLTQVEHEFTVSLPKYLAKFEAAVSAPKQLPLFI